MSHRKVSSQKHWRGKGKTLSKKLRQQNPFPSVTLFKTQYRYNDSPIPILKLVVDALNKPISIPLCELHDAPQKTSFTELTL